MNESPITTKHERMLDSPLLEGRCDIDSAASAGLWIQELKKMGECAQELARLRGAAKNRWLADSVNPELPQHLRDEADKELALLTLAENHWDKMPITMPIKMPWSEEHPGNNELHERLGSCAVPERRSYSVGVSVNQPGALEYALFASSIIEYGPGQDYHGPDRSLPTPILISEKPDALVARITEYAYRQVQRDALVEALNEPELSSHSWREKWSELFERDNAPFLPGKGMFPRLRMESAIAIGLVEPTEIGSQNCHLTANAAGRIVHNHPVAPRYFRRSPLFEPSAHQPDPSRTILAENNKFYTLTEDLDIEGLEPHPHLNPLTKPKVIAVHRPRDGGPDRTLFEVRDGRERYHCLAPAALEEDLADVAEERLSLRRKAIDGPQTVEAIIESGGSSKPRLVNILDTQGKPFYVDDLRSEAEKVRATRPRVVVQSLYIGSLDEEVRPSGGFDIG